MSSGKRIQLYFWRIVFSYYIFERIVNQFLGNMNEHYFPAPDLFAFYHWMPDTYGWYFGIISAIVYGIVVFLFLMAFTFNFIVVELPKINVKRYRTLLVIFMVICIVDAVGCFVIVPVDCHPLFSGIMDSLMIGLSVWMCITDSIRHAGTVLLC